MEDLTKNQHGRLTQTAILAAHSHAKCYLIDKDFIAFTKNGINLSARRIHGNIEIREYWVEVDEETGKPVDKDIFVALFDDEKQISNE